MKSIKIKTRQTQLFLLMVLFFLSNSVVQAVEAPLVFFYPCGYTKTPPKLDGLADDVCWQKATKLNQWWTYYEDNETIKLIDGTVFSRVA